jgi:hypothetical protein
MPEGFADQETEEAARDEAEYAVVNPGKDDE